MEKSQLLLIPVPLKYRFGTYDFNYKYHAGESFTIETIGINSFGNECNVKIQFTQYAEIKIFHFNYWEQNYGDSLIKTPFGDYVEDTFDFKNEKFQNYWIQKDISPDSGFYIVENSSWYEERKIYIDLKSRGYMHFLLTGYESYIELFAKNDFKIEKISAVLP